MQLFVLLLHFQGNRKNYLNKNNNTIININLKLRLKGSMNNNNTNTKDLIIHINKIF